MSDRIIIHVRFSADGSVTEIGERPTSLSAQQWFAKLSERAAPTFEPLSGGRGVFRLSRDEIQALQSAVLQ